MQIQMLTVGWKLREVLNKDSKAQNNNMYMQVCTVLVRNECLNVHACVYERV